MRATIIGGIIVFAGALLTPQIVQAQGTVYLSNLDQAPVGSLTVGYPPWQAAGFFTGSNSSGYLLNNVQLAMTNASVNATNFSIMVYRESSASVAPGGSLGNLDGSTNPMTAGIYTYIPALGFTLLPNSYYFIVLGAGFNPPVGLGHYGWNYTDSNAYNPSGGWSITGFWTSSNSGAGWTPSAVGNFPQYALNATAVPEPGVLSLFGLGGLGFLWQRRKAKAL